MCVRRKENEAKVNVEPRVVGRWGSESQSKLKKSLGLQNAD